MEEEKSIFDEFFEGFENNDLEITHKFGQYFDALIKRDTILGKTVSAEMKAEFQTLSKMKSIFMIAFYCSENGDEFMETLKDQYMEFVGDEPLYLEYFGYACSLAKTLQKDYSYIIKTNEEKELAEKYKETKKIPQVTKRSINDHSEAPTSKKLNINSVNASTSIKKFSESRPKYNQQLPQREKTLRQGRPTDPRLRPKVIETFTSTSENPTNETTKNTTSQKNYRQFIEDLVHTDNQNEFDSRETEYEEDAAEATDSEDDEDYDEPTTSLDNAPIKRTRITFNDKPTVFEVGPRMLSTQTTYISTSEYRSTEISTKRPLGDAYLSAGPDLDVKVSIDKPQGKVLAVPYADKTIPAPLLMFYNEWESPSEAKKIAKDILLQYSFPFPTRKQIRNYRHLFIHDTVLTPANLMGNFKHVGALDIKYPIKYGVILDAFKKIRKEKMNAYIIDKLFICYGIDIAIRSTDPDVCRHEVEVFIDKFLKELLKDFDGKPNRCYPRKLTPSIVPLPKMYFITIPYAKATSSHVLNFNKTIKKINDVYKQYVEDAKKTPEVDFELVDWQESVEEEESEAIEEFDMRYRKLTELLINQCFLPLREET